MTEENDDDIGEIFANMTSLEIEALNNEVIGLTQSPQEIEERRQIDRFASLLREMPPPLWPYIPVHWDTRKESLKFYADNPDEVDTNALHLEKNIDLSILNTELSYWFKLDCVDPWGDGRSGTKTARAMGRWLAGYPVSPSYVEIRDGDKLFLQGNHRLRVAYFAGYRTAPILMPKKQADKILGRIKEKNF